MIPPLSLKQPFLIKTKTIRKVKTVIQTIMAVAFVIFVLIGACFYLVPPVKLHAHRLYHHPSFANNKTSIELLQNKLPAYSKMVQNIPSDFSSMKDNHRSIDFSSSNSIFEFMKKNEYRTDEALLIDANKEWTKAEMEALFNENGGNQQDIKHINSIYEKYETFHSLVNVANLLKDEELTVLKKFIPTSPHAELVPFKLKELSFQIQYLVEKIKLKQIHPIAAAAYIHQEIIRIQPYKTKNMDAATSWMNLILQMGCYMGFSAPDQLHFDAMLDDLKHPGSFVTFIEDCIKLLRKLEK